MRRSPDTERMWRLAARYSTIGIEMAASLAIGTIGGSWADAKFGTAPYLFWFGLVVGVTAATRAVIRLVKSTHLDEL